MLSAIGLSTMIFIVGTLPKFYEPEDPAVAAQNPERETVEAFKSIEMVCVMLFTFEYLARLLTAPTPARLTRVGMPPILLFIDW